MKQILKKKLALVRHGSARRIDPRVRVSAAYELLEACLENKPNPEELEAARYAARAILGEINVLDKSLTRQFGLPGISRWEFNDLCELLAWDRASLQVVIDAMDFADHAACQMSEKFSLATFDPKTIEPYLDGYEPAVARRDREYARYRCAALLPTLVDQSRAVWRRIRKRISKETGSELESHSTNRGSA